MIEKIIKTIDFGLFIGFVFYFYFFQFVGVEKPLALMGAVLMNAINKNR